MGVSVAASGVMHPDAGTEVQLIDVLAELMNLRSVEAFRVIGKSYDCGFTPGYINANVECGSLHQGFGAH